MNSRTWIVLTSILLAAIPASAQQRPLVTEDPETVGINHVLVEAGVEFDRDQFYPATGLTGDTTHIAVTGVSVGIGPSAELQVDGGFYQRLTVTRRVLTPLSGTLIFVGDTTSSLEDLTVATKLRIVQESDQHPGFGVRIGTKLPLADRKQGIGLGTTDFFASLLAAKTVRSVRTVGNVSMLVLGNPIVAQDSRPAVGFGVSVARAVTNELEAVGEINGHFGPIGDTPSIGLSSRGVLRFAARYTQGLLRFDGGLLIGLTSRDPAFGITAGATYVFGK